MAGTFLPGASLREGVVSAAFSGSAGIVKTESEIITLDRAGQPLQSFPAPAGPALFAFDAKGQPAWSYFARTAQLLPIGGDPVDLSALPEILAIESAGRQVHLLVLRDDSLRLLRISPFGQVLAEEALPGLPAARPAFLWNADTVLVTTGSDLVIRQRNSEDQQIALPAPAQDFEPLGRGWIRIGQPDHAPALALRLGKDGPEIYRLPALAENPEAGQ
jgi:hypothetical protein